MHYLLGLVFAVSVFILPRPVLSTFDLNIEEIEMVADHLSPPECRRLASALHFTRFTLNPDNVTGSGEPDVPCLDLLLHWDRQEGRGKSFLDMALRLKQLGHADIADKLSTNVYHEKSEAVKEALSSLKTKDEEDDVNPTEEGPSGADGEGSWTSLHTVCVLLALKMLGVVTYCVWRHTSSPCKHRCHARLRQLAERTQVILHAGSVTHTEVTHQDYTRLTQTEETAELAGLLPGDHTPTGRDTLDGQSEHRHTGIDIYPPHTL